MRTRIGAVALAVLGLVAAACGGGSTATPTASTAASGGATTQPAVTKTLNIGFTNSQTGAQQVASTKQTEGIKLWVDQVTKAGGIKLKDGTVLMPKITFYDDGSATDRVQQLYTKLINDDKVDFLLSPYSSGLVKAAAVVSEQNGKVMVTAGGADDATMEQGFQNIYQVYTPASKYLTGAIDLMLKLDPTIKKVAIVNEKDSFSVSVVAAAKPYAESKGLQVVVNQGYDTGTTDFAPFINQIVAAAPDAIIGGGHLVDGSALAKALKEKNVSARFVALLVAPPEPTFADLGDAAQFIVGPSQWEPAVKYSEAGAKALNIPYYGIAVDAFTSAYRAMFNAAPSYHSAGGYAAGLVLQKALEDAGSTDPAKVKAALDKTDIMTFFGHIKFSTDQKTHGKQVAHDMVYVQWLKGSDGKLATQIVWPPEAKTADAQLRK
ncbi:MAG TPA: amino acid ABC transporter substrate-binding protein [Candidatus Limnocylindria bacterium]|nr:amino acid ABC transporter substrate-binding protein [Candidatus Limnocylindria bacterium]